MTVTEIQTRITSIETAIDDVLIGGKSYTLSDGQGSQTVQRSSLGELTKMLNHYNLQLSNLTGSGCCVSTGRSRNGY